MITLQELTVWGSDLQRLMYCHGNQGLGSLHEERGRVVEEL